MVKQGETKVETVLRLVLIVVLTAECALVTLADDASSSEPPRPKDSQKLLVIRSKGKYGVIDRSGKLIIPPRFDSLFLAFDSRRSLPASEQLSIQENEDIFPAQLNHQWGYFDKNGKEVISPQYSMAGIFHDGLAQVQVDGKWGIIDRAGKFIVEPQYSYIGSFFEGIARVAIGGYPLEGGFPKSKWGFIDKRGKQLVPAKFDYAQTFSNGRALVNIGGRWRGEAGLFFQGGLWGVIDNSGKFVVEPKIEIASGLSLDEKTQTNAAELLPVKYDGKFGYRDRSWKIAIEPKFGEARPFSQGLAAVKIADKFGYIDKTGRFVIEPRFKSAGEFSEGLAPVVSDTGVQFIDKHGKEILKIECDEALPFDSGIAAVRVGKLWGFIDKAGHYVHKPQFARIYRPGRGDYDIENPDGLRGLMNPKGTIIVPPKYGFIGGFQTNGFAMIDTESMGLPSEFWVIDREGRRVPGPMLPLDAGNRNKKIAFLPKRVDGKWGLVNDKGEFVIAPRFGGVKMLGVGILGVQEGTKWGMVDLENGKLIIEPTYYSIDRFSEGLAVTRPNPWEYPLRSGESFGYIDMSGKLVIPNKFDFAYPFKNGIALVQMLYHGDTDFYYIDKQGRYLWHPDGN